jgi:hypothetical protein
MSAGRTVPSHEGVRICRPEGCTSGKGPVRYSIATLVSDALQYEAMRTSFRSGGFDGDDCEYLYVDNSGSRQTCAFRGLDAMLSAARGAFVILCHQDVRLLTDARRDLDARLAELDSLDSHWAIAGNAGGIAPGALAIRITDPHGANQHVGKLPVRVMSVDENFMVVRRAARIGFSADLTGFHFYGADLCLHADIAGYSAYVIDFHLAHLSGGTKSAAFVEMEKAFRGKWERALRGRWMQTTCALVRLSGGPLGQFVGRLAEAPVERISRRRPTASGWKSRS